MPSLKIEILIQIEEGLLFCLSDPCRQIKIGGSYIPKTFYKTVGRLENEGLIKKIKKEQKIHLRLTEQGKGFINKHRKTARRISPAWDKKWRIVIFDIPENKRNLRDRLRRYLRTLGYGNVQRSIWISPHDFTEIIRRYAEKMKLSEYIFQITAENFQGFSEAMLVEKFWDVEDINRKYLELIERYQKKKKQLAGLIGNSPERKDIPKKILYEYLLWDYRNILNKDPHLPPELLPAGWGGDQARQFVKSFLQSWIK